MNWLVFGGSLAAVLALAGTTRLLRLGGAARSFLEPDEAIEAAEHAVAGLTGYSAAIGSDGRAALVFGLDGRIVVLKTHGARVATRLVTWDDIRVTPAGLLIETRDRRFGAVLVAEVDNIDARRLAPPLTQV